MIHKKKGQISVEYLVVISFVTFIVLTVLGISLFYSSQVQDAIKFNQIERFAKKVISAAESTFYSGEPSRTTISSYIPRGVNTITISENSLIFEVSSNSGISRTAYPSKVPLEDGMLSPSSGLKKVLIIAGQNKVTISD